MKKAVVLGMILLALGTLAYADASVGFGWGRTTFTVAGSQDLKAPFDNAIQSGWGIWDWPPTPRENLDLVWSGDHTAFKITGYLNGTVMSWVNIYGTLKLMPDMFSVLIGEFNGDGWDAFRKTSPHPIHDVNNGNVGRFSGYGVILDVAPKDSGFEGAVMIKTGEPAGYPFDSAFLLNGSADSLTETFTNTNVGFSYTVPNTVKITAGSTTAVLGHASRNIFGRVELLMVPNLTAWADVKYDGFDQTNAVSNINAELAGAYDMKPMTIVVAATLASLDGTTGFGVSPEVYYNLGAFTVGLYANVNAGDTSNFSDSMGYTVEPYIKLNDFNTRISFAYSHVAAHPDPEAGGFPIPEYNVWRIPIMIDWGF